MVPVKAPSPLPRHAALSANKSDNPLLPFKSFNCGQPSLSRNQFFSYFTTDAQSSGKTTTLATPKSFGRLEDARCVGCRGIHPRSQCPKEGLASFPRIAKKLHIGRLLFTEPLARHSDLVGSSPAHVQIRGNKTCCQPSRRSLGVEDCSARAVRSLETSNRRFCFLRPFRPSGWFC